MTARAVQTASGMFNYRAIPANGAVGKLGIVGYVDQKMDFERPSMFYGKCIVLI